MVRPSVGNTRDVDRNSELQAENAQLQQTNAGLESRLAKLEAELESVRRELDMRARQQRTIRDLEREIARLRERLEQYEPGDQVLLITSESHMPRASVALEQHLSGVKVRRLSVPEDVPGFKIT